jgi:hypothetical protein
MNQDATGEALSDLSALRFVPHGEEGFPRGTCESCGRFLWSEGGFKVPALKGLFCSLTCTECGIAERTNSRKKIPGAPIGSGARLLAYLKSEAPEIYAQLLNACESASNQKACLECGTALEGKRSGSQFCSAAHRMRFRRSGKSRTSQNGTFIANTPIGKQGLTDAKNANWTHTPRNPISALSAPQDGE